MIYKTSLLIIGLLAGHAATAPTEVERFDNEGVDSEIVDSETDEARRELFPLYAVGNKCARRGCSVYQQIERVSSPAMVIGDAKFKGPVKALEMLALNDDLHTVVNSDSYCTRRQAMARAAGLAAGMAMATVNTPGFAAQTAAVKMGSDSGQLVFSPDEIKICKGDSITWTNNKGGPHNVVFDEEAIPSGVTTESVSMPEGELLGDEGATFTKKFEVAGEYSYYCEPHRGAGMNGQVIVA
jgi:plastocyanin